MFLKCHHLQRHYVFARVFLSRYLQQFVQKILSKRQCYVPILSKYVDYFSGNIYLRGAVCKSDAFFHYLKPFRNYFFKTIQ